MDEAISALREQLARVRTGRASAALLDNISVDYYGTSTPVSQASQISTPEARLLVIRPFDKALLRDIEKALINANLGATPSNDGNLIRLPFPPLTEERRKSLAKEVKKLGEEGKITLRNLRRQQNELVKQAKKAKELSEDDSKQFQKVIQEITDRFVDQIDNIIDAKEEELLTI